MTPRKILALYDEYRDMFKYRDMAYIGICQTLGISEKNSEADDEDVI